MSENEKYRGWESDEDLNWLNVWVPDQPGLPFERMLNDVKQANPDIGEPQEYRCRRGPKPDVWMVQIGHRKSQNQG